MIHHFFELNTEMRGYLHNMVPEFGFGGFGETVYYRTYSRLKDDGTQEHWADTVIRVIEGIFSIRKDWYITHGLKWDEPYWQGTANAMATSMFFMRWLPPGRGLWAMGTRYAYERGSAALNNCAYADTTDLSWAAEWTTDMLMCGCGVGFNTAWAGGAFMPDKKRHRTLYSIPDTREGWAYSVWLLISAYTDDGFYPIFDYSRIRPEGAPIRGFGGTASGAGPLKALHKRMERYLDAYCLRTANATRTVVDLMNAIGACVVAGNVRRSAEISMGSPEDETFLNLKNYDLHPERADIGWMSNNSVALKAHEDFEALPQLADRIRDNGEPGIMNLLNVQKFGRFGKETPDEATGMNPCGEIPLESAELCNLAEVFPGRCHNKAEFEASLYYATLYASTVSLLPTHRPETNAVIARNRRIGVSISGVADLLNDIGAAMLTRWLRDGYKLVRQVNTDLAKEAGVPASIRVTTVKPSGTISQLVGVSSGMHWPTFQYAIRRMRVGNHTPICQVLKEAGVPHEPDTFSAGTTVFSFPIYNGSARPAQSVSAWEQLAFLAMLQREWADNSVSCTVYFDPETEGPQIEHMLAQFAPIVKSLSMLPHTENGAYPQMPYEGISEEKYHELIAQVPLVDWSKFGGSDGMDSKFCTNDTCEV